MAAVVSTRVCVCVWWFVLDAVVYTRAHAAVYIRVLRYIYVCTGRDSQRASCRAHAAVLLLACVCLVLTPSHGAQGGLRRRFDRGYVRHRHSASRATVHGLPPVTCPASHVYVLCGVLGNKMCRITICRITMCRITRPCVSDNLHPCLAHCTHASPNPCVLQLKAFIQVWVWCRRELHDGYVEWHHHPGR